MAKITSRNSLDATFYLSKFILDGDCCDLLQEAIIKYASAWAQGLHIYLYGEKPIEIELNEKSALKKALIKRFLGCQKSNDFLAGESDGEPVIGSVEIRGYDKSFLIVIRVDERIFRRMNGELQLGNSVAFQVLKEKIDGKNSIEWMEEIFRHLCSSLHPEHAFSRVSEEYWGKNICENDGVYAVGIDYAKALPGIYWLNFFGQTCRKLIGPDKPFNVPGNLVRNFSDGYLVKLHEDPRLWNSVEYKQNESAVLEALGKQYFFDKNEPNRKTCPPDWGLSSINQDGQKGKHIFRYFP